MALKDAVLAIAEGMEEDAKAYMQRKELETAAILLAYAKQLAISLKAAEGETSKSPWSNAVPPEVQHERMMEAARQEARKKKAEAQTNLEPRQVLVEGIEEMAGCYVPVPQELPEGAFTMIAGKKCVLKADGKLHAVNT